MAGSSRTSSRSSWAPEGVHGDLELVLELPAIDRLNLFLKAALFVQQLFHLIRREFLAEPVAHRFILAQQVDDVPTALLDDFLDSLPLVELGLLLQEPDGIAFGKGDLPKVVLVHARDDAQHRALPRAIQPEDADLGPVIEG